MIRLKKQARFIALFSIVCILISLFGVHAAAYSNPAAAASKNVEWFTVNNVLSAERKADTFIVHTALKSTTGSSTRNLDFYITFPVEGGFRLRLSEDTSKSGFFEPSALQTISYKGATDTKTVVYGADGTVLTFLKTVYGFSIAVGNQKQATLVNITSDDMLFGFIGANVEKFKMSMPLRDGEAIYNGSERFNAVNQVGQAFSLRNEDCWSDDPASYINVPLFHSSMGYSVWYNMTYTASADVGKTDPNAYVVDFEGGKVDFYMWSGTILENIKKYTAITGTSIVPPKWAFGYWLGAQAVPWRTNASGVTQTDGSTAAKEVCYQNLVDMFEGYEKMGITDFAAVYGEGMNSTMMPESYEYVNSRGSRMLMWYTPQGYSSTSHMPKLLPSVNTKDWPLPLNISNPVAGNYLGSFIDYTHPNARAAVVSFFNGGTSISHYLNYWNLGLKGAMIDYGEWLREDVTCYNGLNGDEMHNFMSYYYAKVQKEAWDAFYLDGDYILFERSGCAGSQAFVANFTGDQHGDWEGLGDQVTGILSMSTGGFNIVGGDMGGFGKGCSEELYMRWVQFSAFSPLMRLHGQELRTPWGKGDKAYDMFPTYYWLRQNLQDALYSAAIDANKNAVPMVQPLGVAYQNQNGVHDVDDQYLFCNSLLVNPIITEGATSREVLLPEGNWYDLWNHDRVEGNRTITVNAPQHVIPVYLKSGAVVPVDLPSSLQIAKTMQGVTKYESLLITPPDNTTQTVVYDTESEQTTYVSHSASSNLFSVTANKASNRQGLVLYGVDADAISVDGVALTALNAMPKVGSDQYGFYSDNDDVTYLWLPKGWKKIAVSHLEVGLPFKTTTAGLLGYNTTVVNRYPSGQSYANYTSSSIPLQKEFVDYMESHYDYYYTDYSNGNYVYNKVPFVGNASQTAWNCHAIFANVYLQISANMTNLQGTAMRQIAALVPKAADGDPLVLKDFSADFGIRFERTYGSVAFAFRQSKPGGFFTGNGEATDQTYLKVSPVCVELYDRGTKKVLHTYTGTTPGSTGTAQNFTVSVTVTGNTLKYTVKSDNGGAQTATGTVTISDTDAGYMSLAMVGAYNGLRLLNVSAVQNDANGLPIVQASPSVTGGKLKVTRVTDAPNANGYYAYKVVALPDSGYQLRAGSLLAVDVDGNKQVPVNADYRKGGAGDTFIVYAKAATQIHARFYKPDTTIPNVSLIGTSVHEGNCGLRFVYRLQRKMENNVPYVLLDGKWVQVKDYGVLVAAAGVVGNQRLDVELSEKNSYVKKISIPQAGKHYDLSDNFADVSVQIVGLDRVTNGRTLNLIATAYVQLDNGTYLYANSYTDNYVNAGGTVA